uniref:Uncharacterized protein n=1 Tax=Anopheles albimanus TaxID=7167 RepID=A0A182FGY1_ANOAL
MVKKQFEILTPTLNTDDGLLSFNDERNENGYSFSYRTNDGQYRREEGVIDPETGILRITGHYEYTDAEGKVHSYDYVADENGYRTEPAISSATPFAGPIAKSFECLLGGAGCG